MLMTICLTASSFIHSFASDQRSISQYSILYKYNNEHVLNRILPIKTEWTYQLRPRRHNRSLTMKANAMNECGTSAILSSECFSRTSINFTVSHFYYWHLLLLFFMCLYGCGLSTFIKLLSDLIWSDLTSLHESGKMFATVPLALCGLRGCKNRPAPFLTKPGSVRRLSEPRFFWVCLLCC